MLTRSRKLYICVAVRKTVFYFYSTFVEIISLHSRAAFNSELCNLSEDCIVCALPGGTYGSEFKVVILLDWLSTTAVETYNWIKNR